MNSDDNSEQYISEPIIGIDLGTTNTCVAIWRDGNLEVIPDEYGNRTIPSFVAYTNINRYVGLDAKNQKDINPTNVFYEVKRLIGRKYDDPIIENEREFFSYKIGAGENNNIVLLPELKNNRPITPEEISSAILHKAKLMANNYLKKKITKCVITIPAYFNDGQRQATRDAASIAGLECLRIINEPTSAALAYGLLKRTKTHDDQENKKTIMVYDFGGGTLDISLLNIENGTFEVCGGGGNTRMGGSDFDNRLMSYSIQKFKKNNNIKELNEISSLSLQKLRLSCEQAKKILSNYMKTQIAVKNFHNNIDLFIPITRVEFEKICMDLFLICMKPVDDVLRKCELSIENIDEVILVGGMTRIPKIRELLKMKFRKDPNCTINPDEAVAAGAAIQGYLLSHRTDPFSEAVTILDSTTLSLGVETIGGVMDIIIGRGTIIPTSESRTYSTDQDYVDSVLIKIFEGERTLTKDNFFVGEFELSGLEKKPRGIHEIEVTFNIDTNGIITVSAENKKTNDKSSLTITSHKGRLTIEQIESLIEESKELECRDQLEKRKKVLHYEIDDFCNNTLINLSNNDLKLTEESKQLVLNDINKVLSWLKEKRYDEREEEEYDMISTNLKKQYGVLILKSTFEDQNVKAHTTESQATTIYEDEESEETIKQTFEKLEEGDFLGMTDSEKTELKELKQALSDLCYSIFDILSSDNIKLSKDHISELRDYIDDSLLWLCVHEKPSKLEYKMKIDDINKTCNQVFDHYIQENKAVFKQDEFIDSMKNKRDELENLCYVLYELINENAFPIKKELLDKLDLENTLRWIYENDSQENKEEFYEKCNSRLQVMNEYCNELHQKMQGINIDSVKDSLNEQRNVVLTGYIEDEKLNLEQSENSGTDIITIIRKRQQMELNNMINNTEVEEAQKVPEAEPVQEAEPVPETEEVLDETVNDLTTNKEIPYQPLDEHKSKRKRWTQEDYDNYKRKCAEAMATFSDCMNKEVQGKRHSRTRRTKRRTTRYLSKTK